jgi:hypothetical protein
MTSNPAQVTAPYQLSIEKYYAGEYWVNRYFLSTLALTDARTAANAIAALERTLYSGYVVMTKMSISSTQQGDFVYETIVLNQPGGRDIALNQMLPLFVVVRVDFSVQASRPSRKYLRGVLIEPDINGVAIEPAIITMVNTNYATKMAAIADFVDPQGSDIVTGACHPQVAMRQLRRGSKKRPVQS